MLSSTAEGRIYVKEKQFADKYLEIIADFPNGFKGSLNERISVTMTSG